MIEEKTEVPAPETQKLPYGLQLIPLTEVAKEGTQRVTEPLVPYSELQDELVEMARRQQEFFASIAREMRLPHYGHVAKQLFGALLLRAQEAQLYDPNQE